MKRKRQTKTGRAVYAARKTIVEPVIRSDQPARGFRQSLLRGLVKVRGEWALLCLTHNILRFAKRPRFHLHFTPTDGSWINLVERWFAEMTNQRIRRGVFRSVKELEVVIREYLDVLHNESPKPFVWTKTADEILANIARYSQRTHATQPR